MNVVSVSDAARILGTSESSVRYWMHTGKLAGFRTPRGQRLFLRADVESLAQARAHRR
jgi:excisionase family DNA binding protein